MGSATLTVVDVIVVVTEPVDERPDRNLDRARRRVGGVPTRDRGATPPGTYTLTAFCVTCGRDMPHVSSTGAAYSYRCRRCGRQRGTAVAEYVAASGRQPRPADPAWLAQTPPGQPVSPW